MNSPALGFGRFLGRLGSPSEVIAHGPELLLGQAPLLRVVPGPTQARRVGHLHDPDPVEQGLMPRLAEVAEALRDGLAGEQDDRSLRDAHREHRPEPLRFMSASVHREDRARVVLEQVHVRRPPGPFPDRGVLLAEPDQVVLLQDVERLHVVPRPGGELQVEEVLRASRVGGLADQDAGSSRHQHQNPSSSKNTQRSSTSLGTNSGTSNTSDFFRSLARIAFSSDVTTSR